MNKRWIDTPWRSYDVILMTQFHPIRTTQVITDTLIPDEHVLLDRKSVRAM